MNRKAKNQYPRIFESGSILVTVSKSEQKNGSQNSSMSAWFDSLIKALCFNLKLAMKQNCRKNVRQPLLHF